MKFGLQNVADAGGAVLAHSALIAGRRLRKGSILTPADIDALQAADVQQVTVAQLSPGDVHEDDAARQLAAALMPTDSNHLRLNTAFTGRVNIYSRANGLFRVDADAVNNVNGVDASITVATLADYSRISEGALLATVKIIPFAVSGAHLKQSMAAAPDAMHVAPFVAAPVTLIQTRTDGMKQSVLDKGHLTMAHRLQSMGCDLLEPVTTPHRVVELAATIGAAKTDLVLILMASATSDIRDVGPSALVAAGGRMVRFGMPVDPGNLLFLGRLDDKIIVGLPGCVRSPALNGADWILERLLSGIDVSDEDMALMGVGGLLKEIPTRTQSRGGETLTRTRPNTEIIILAAGASSRMNGVDKLLEEIDGEPLLRRAVRSALAAGADRVNVVVQPDNDNRRQTLDGLNVQTIVSADWRNGMAASVRAGLRAVSPDCDAVIISLADMPELTADHFDRLIAAYDPGQNHEICRATAADGTPGHPVLFGRRFFETLAALQGDRGARAVIDNAMEFLVDVPTQGQGALVDLDTPQDWADWRRAVAR